MKLYHSILGSATMIVVVLVIWPGCKNQSIQPTNHDPVITSFVASTNQVQLPDTFSVTCDAFDSDGDSLLFNWGCPSFITMEGASSTTPYVLQDSKQHIVTFYTPATVEFQLDTITISCGVVDGRGGWASTFLHLPLKR